MEDEGSDLLCLVALNARPHQRAIVHRATGAVVRFSSEATCEPVGLWQRHPSGDYMVLQEPEGARFRYPGEPSGGLVVGPEAKVWPLRGRWRTHRWLVVDGDSKHVVSIRMSLGNWLMHALQDPLEADERDLLSLARREDGTLVWAQRA